jgi:hypothetical protein
MMRMPDADARRGASEETGTEEDKEADSCCGGSVVVPVLRSAVSNWGRGLKGCGAVTLAAFVVADTGSSFVVSATCDGLPGMSTRGWEREREDKWKGEKQEHTHLK